MRLEKLEIRGFKSFAQKVEIAFDKGMTAIVGPNGSGKSNIADAIRWVLGEQSAKQLRGGKMEDVIFSGSESARAQAYCEVSLYFDNADRALPIDFHEVSIMRRVYRSGESEYYINRNACRLRDIVDLFRDTGVGKEGYSIIGQGRVDEILSGRSDDRRAVFEESAGITKYKARKQEAERKLEKSVDNLLRIEDILQELESQLEPLRNQSDNARQYLKLREELKTFELNAFLQQYDALTKRLKDCEEIAAQTIAVCAAIDVDIESQSGEQQSLTADLREREAETSRRHARLLQLTGEAEKADGEAALLAERIAAQREQSTRAADRDREMEERIVNWDTWLDGAVGDNEQRQSVADALQSDIDVAESALAAETNAIEADETALEEAKNAIIEAMNRLSNAKVRNSRLETMRTSLHERRDAVDAERQKAETERDELAVDAAHEQTEYDALAAEDQTLAARHEAQLHDADAQRHAVDDALASLRADERKRDETTSRLKVLREMTREYEGYAASVRRLLRDVRKDETLGQGIRGVVAELIRAPAQLEKAIENALGSALQQIVTDDEAAAKRAIAHLRSHQYGRATFLPRNAIQPRTLSAHERRTIDRNGCLGVASELIRCDDAYRVVAAHLLGRTAIVETLDDGIAIAREARHSFRIATLGGDLINQGGSMTGGSAQKSEFSLLGRGREIEELAAALSVLEDTIAQKTEELDRQREAVATHETACAELARERHAVELKLTRQREKLELLARLADQQRERQKALQQEADQIAETLADVEAQLDAAKAQQEELLTSSDLSQQDIKTAQQALSERRAARDRAVTSLNDDKVRLMGLRKEKSALDAEIERVRRERQDAIQQRARDAAQTQADADQAEQWARESTICRDRAARLRDEMANAETQNAEAEAERQQLQQRADALTARIEQLRRERQDADERRHKAELAAGKARSEWESLQERIWEEYEMSYEGALAFRTDLRREDAQRGMDQCRAALKALGDVNVNAIEDYRSVKQRFDDMNAQRDDLKSAQADLETLIADLTETMRRRFSEQFARIGVYFGETFQELFNGGRSELRLADPEDVMNSDIEIIAQPPGKKLQLLSLLSGGERALTAIALLFSMLKLKPTPFCVLDEIEASLDEANVDLFANYVKRYASDTQFILITHRKGSMVVCDALYGVAMEGKGVSRLVSVKLSDVEKLAEHSA